MSDLGFDYTEEEIKRIEKELNKLYSQAAKDLKSKLDSFTDKYETKEQIHLQELKDGKITQDDFDAWKRGQVFQGEQWEAKRQQVLYTMTQTNKMASEIVNNEAINVFTMNGNYAAYNLEKTGGVNFGFSLYDTSSVAEIVKQEDPTLLPKWKVNEPKDYVWNSKKVGNQITQGIIQGEKLDEIANRLVKNLCMQNENSSLTFARTAMTGAQNGGRTLRFRQAEELGIKLHQEWMATLDGRTRSSHRHMDGEKIPIGKNEKFSNKCRYPGDPEGPPWEVYNCRCTLVADLDDYPAEYKRYDNIDGKPIKNMTYKEWYKSKKKNTNSPNIPSIISKWRESDAAIKTVNQGIERVTFLQGQISKEEAKQLLDTRITDIVNKSEVGMSIRQDDLIKALDEGSFKNVYQTGNSTFNKNLKFRNEAENIMFSIDESTNAEDRPIYGALVPHTGSSYANYFYKAGPLTKYGDGVTVVFKKDTIINDSTLTCGDSLNYAGRIGVTSLSNPEYVGMYNVKATVAMSRGESMQSLSDRLDHYFEVQIHGAKAHSVKNIDYVVVNPRWVDQSFINNLRKRGIKVEEV